MKKQILLILLFTLPIVLFAQQFKGGAIVGLNMAQVHGDHIYGYNRPGINTGLMVEARFTQNISMSMETLYSQKGAWQRAKNPNANNGKTSEYRLNLHYLDIPVLFHITDKEFISAGGGFSYGRLISSDEEEHSGNQDPYINQVPFNDVDVQWLIDFRIRMYKNLKFNLRYSRSIAPIRTRDFDVNNEQWTWDQYNYMLSFRLIWIFNEKELRPVDKRTPDDLQ